MKRDKDWQKFEDYIVESLRDIDEYCRASKGSGNKGELHDIKTKTGIAVECKFRRTKSVTIKEKTWEKLVEEIPFHSDKIPVLALQNKNKKKWAVLDLDDFLEMYKELYRLTQ